MTGSAGVDLPGRPPATRNRAVVDDVIVEVTGGEMLVAAVSVIQAAFRTVLDEMRLTAADVPTNPAFLTAEDLRTALDDGSRLFAAVESGRPVGTVSLPDAPGWGVEIDEESLQRDDYIRWERKVPRRPDGSTAYA